MRFAYFYKTGEVAEWLKALVSKTNMGVSPSGVRIPPSPPIFTFCEIVRNSLGAKRLGMVFFRNFEGIFEIARQRAGLNSLKNIVN